MANTEVRIGAAGAAASRTRYAPWYQNYVLAVLFAAYVVNVMDRAVVGVLNEPIKQAFQLTDTQLGMLTGLAFAIFYAVCGIPMAVWADRTSRRNVLAFAVGMWSVMTALCGAAVNFATLLSARIGTAVGEAGGTPPSHSLISDYFPLSRRATALSTYALGVTLGAMAGAGLGGWANQLFGWRTTFFIVGTPGVIVALLILFTVREPPRGHSDAIPPAIGSVEAPRIAEVLRHLWKRHSFRHLSFAAGLHSFVWYAGSSWNASYLIRSHHMTTGPAGSLLAAFSAVGALGTLMGGYFADRLSSRTRDRRWYLWVPAWSIVAMIPFQFSSYLGSSLSVVVPSFAIMSVLASFFFGPSFAMTQALASLRMRTIAASILLFVQTMVGQGLGPYVCSVISDHLRPTLGAESLRYGLTAVGLVNIWAAAHYFWGARSLRADLDATQAPLAPLQSPAIA